MSTRTLTRDEHTRVAEAIRSVEQNTSGEIYCVVARTSGPYFIPAALVVVISMLTASLGAAFALEYWWLSVRPPVFVGAQLLATAAGLAVLHAFPLLRLRLVPRGWQFGQARDNALRQFLARNVHRTAERTGVLIFVSLAERYAEIVADSGINSRVEQTVWDGTVASLIDHARRDRLADGFVSAVETVGKLLSVHFPVTAGDVNELEDHLIEI